MNEYALLSIAGLLSVGLLGWAAVWLHERSAAPPKDEAKPRPNHFVIPDDPALRAMAAEMRSAVAGIPDLRLDASNVTMRYSGRAEAADQ